jgi:NAD(P)H-nitrite reductase large subunit
MSPVASIETGLGTRAKRRRLSTFNLQPSTLNSQPLTLVPTAVELDDEVCLCFHVTKRKLLSYIRIEKPRRPAQLSECFGAGTGCGWCRKYLTRMFEAAQAGEAAIAEEPDADHYASGRSDYVREGGGTPPPGATPIEG